MNFGTFNTFCPEKSYDTPLLFFDANWKTRWHVYRSVATHTLRMGISHSQGHTISIWCTMLPTLSSLTLTNTLQTKSAETFWSTYVISLVLTCVCTQQYIAGLFLINLYNKYTKYSHSLVGLFLLPTWLAMTDRPWRQLTSNRRFSQASHFLIKSLGAAPRSAMIKTLTSLFPFAKTIIWRWCEAVQSALLGENTELQIPQPALLSLQREATMYSLV